MKKIAVIQAVKGFAYQKSFDSVIQKGLAEEALRAQLSSLLWKTSTKVVKDFYQEALDVLDKSGSTEQAIEYLQKKTGDLPQKARRLAEDSLADLTGKLYKSGLYHAARGLALDVSLALVDKDAISVLGQQNLFWLGKHYSDDVKNKIDTMLTEYFQEGLTRAKFAARIEENLSDLVKHDGRYWSDLADHMATKVREMGRVSTYEQSGIEYVKVKAVMDDKTSDICRDMHGRIISVKRLVEQRDTILAAKSKMELMDAAQWIDDFKGKTSDLPDGVGMPPYHWRCRTITVAYFEGLSDAGRPITYYDGAQKQKDTVAYTVHDKRIGKEFILTDGAMEHIQSRHELDQEKIESAMRSISKWGENENERGQWIAKSQNGVILAFRDNCVYTAFLPDNPDGYFRNHVIQESVHKSVRKSIYKQVSRKIYHNEVNI